MTPIWLTSVDITVVERTRWKDNLRYSFQPTLQLSSVVDYVYIYSWWKPQWKLKALYWIFSLGSLCFSDVYRLESSMCRTLPFFVTIFIFTIWDKGICFYVISTLVKSITLKREEDHYGGEGPHWALVPIKKKKIKVESCNNLNNFNKKHIKSLSFLNLTKIKNLFI